MNKQYIWYACYGSNLLKERFMYYIGGGVCRFNGTRYRGCTDQSEPLDDRPCIVKHELYFGNSSSKWDDGGVAFLNKVRNENVLTLGRMYLISEDQFKEVQEQEGLGWYNEVLDLGMEDGVPVKSFTHSSLFSRNIPSEKYIGVVKAGISESYPGKSSREIIDYLYECMKA